MNLIQTLEAEAIQAFHTGGKAIPEFRPGDTLRVGVKVVEGDRTRVQNYEGVCIARANKGLGSSFTVRKLSFGEGVERVFPLYSPNIDSIEVVRRGAVRRAKLYYLRGRTGKSARIAERRDTRAIASQKASPIADVPAAMATEVDVEPLGQMEGTQPPEQQPIVDTQLEADRQDDPNNDTGNPPVA